MRGTDATSTPEVGIVDAAWFSWTLERLRFAMLNCRAHTATREGLCHGIELPRAQIEQNWWPNLYFTVVAAQNLPVCIKLLLYIQSHKAECLDKNERLKLSKDIFANLNPKDIIVRARNPGHGCRSRF